MRWLSAFVFTAWMGLALPAGADQAKIEEGFSYTPPAGWQVRSLAGQKYKVALAPAVDGYAPHIIVADELFYGGVEDYTKGLLDTLSKQKKGFKNLGQATLVTAAGLKGMRLLVESMENEVAYRSLVFIFPGTGDLKLIMSFNARSADGDKHDAVVDAALKTLVVK
jgi:hypothetical protein